ncbi:Hypothetical predicted protein [Paramuricea clavata]|uniref:Uncharacterized protein n=1 Tax=Paramuricea clavata TaxID=317549 RepID=A0A6S7IY32_PARCT|nr:Hypothetical predicted protein [Paramuricea clavata]
MEIIKKSHLDPALPKSTFHHIGQDIKKSDSTCENIYKSSIKRDFPALGYVTRQSRIPSPKSAKIFSVEARINEQKSLTATHFAKQNVTERATLSEVAKLASGTKNLMKMDVDNRAMSFDTTNKLYFPARVLEMVKGKDDMMRSSIPQGDKEKVRLPLSNYKQSFPEDQLSKLDVATLAQFKTPPVLRGDTRSYDDQFETTNSKTFGGHCITLQKLKAIKNNGCSIRHGDPDKCLYSVTTSKKFFKEKPFERVDPCGPNYVSNIVLGDDRGEWSLKNYKTNRGPLPRVETQHLVSRLAKLNMAKSSLPMGDMDPDRAQKRITQTTSKSFFRKPVVLFPYAKVNGAYLLTKSKIKFGTKNAVTQHNTTTRSNFPAMSEPVKRRDCQTTNSNVCLDYYGDESNQSPTVCDFYPHIGAKRLLPNPNSIAKLTASHIQLPKTLTSEFRTSHNISYPPKQSKRETYEAGRLHKSSIKLGNINVH